MTFWIVLVLIEKKIINERINNYKAYQQTVLEILTRRGRYTVRSISYKHLWHAPRAGLLAGTFIFMLCLICALMKTNQM